LLQSNDQTDGATDTAGKLSPIKLSEEEFIRTNLPKLNGSDPTPFDKRDLLSEEKFVFISGENPFSPFGSFEELAVKKSLLQEFRFVGVARFASLKYLKNRFIAF
jgi:hypothetical protein